LVNAVTATNPGYTANLPGSLIEDMVSTIVAAVALCDSARVDLVNSVTPYGANVFILNQLGQIYGVPRDKATNTSVNVVFTGTPGFPISRGFIVSDGAHQYTVQTALIIPASGVTGPVYCLATITGSWAVPANTVTTVVTSLAGAIVVTVTNPQAGTPSIGAQSDSDYRASVLQAGLASASGMSRYLKNLLSLVSGVQTRLIAVQQSGTNWRIIVGGGDPYEVAFAIYTGMFNIGNLVGSQLAVTAISQAAAAVVTMNLAHGFTTGQTKTIAGALGMVGVNGARVITVLSPTTFSVPYNSSAAPAYTGGAVVTPIARNQVVSVNDYPDTYSIPFVLPPAQSVTVSLTWNTISTNVISTASVAILGAAAIVDYINNIAVGAPINLFSLQNVFVDAVAAVVPPAFLTRMVFAVYINSVLTAPTAGTGVIAGDPESYFLTDVTLITITQA
jgi:hypothetical protein